jgi:hypothetical protein
LMEKVVEGRIYKDGVEVQKIRVAA